MITRVIVAAVVVSFAASFTFGQVKYSRPQPSTPTPSPTPAQGMMQNQRTIRQRSTPAPTPSKIRPSGKAPIAENQPFIPARKGTAAPTPAESATFQRTMATSSKTMSSQRTAVTQVQTQPIPLPAQAPPKPTPTPVPPPDVQAYLDHQLVNSKDQKFHMTVNGKDLALRPFHVWPQKITGVGATSTCVDMRSDDGAIYDIDVVTTGGQVSSFRIHRINGESVR